MKPIIEARADAARIAGNAIGGGKTSENSHATSPIRTDEAVANLASISSNTIRKIEQIEQQAAPVRTKQQKKQRQRLFTVKHAPVRVASSGQAVANTFTLTQAAWVGKEAVLYRPLQSHHHARGC